MIEVSKYWGYRGMVSDKASKVKRTGHEKEKLLASLLNIPCENIVTGTGKTDLITSDGKRISLKSSHDKAGRSQICLYKYGSRYFRDNVNGSTIRMRKCLEVFPETYLEYKESKDKIKGLLQSRMIELRRYINESKLHKREYLDFIFFTDHNKKHVSFLVVEDQYGRFHIFDSNDVLDVFSKHTKVVNSVARHVYETSNQKVLFKGKNERGLYVNIIENEIRTSTHYRSFLAVGNKTKYLFVLRSNIEPVKKKKDRLFVYGKTMMTYLH